MEGQKLVIPPLEERLRQALFMAPAGKVCADIGADHGQLSAALLQSGRAEYMLVSDVSEKSLAKARRLLNALNLSSRATFVVADGLAALDALPQGEVAAAFLLGMGGVTLSRILETGWRKLRGATLVLGAQTDLPLLRRTVVEIGYRVRDERAVREKDRGYILMACAPAREGEPAYDERQLLLGPVLLSTLPPAWKYMLLKRQSVLTHAVEAMERTARDERRDRLAAQKRELTYITETLERYEREMKP